MDAKTKRYLLVTAFGIGLFAILMNFSEVLALAGKGFSLILPVIVGCILSLFIRVPMGGIEKILERMMRGSKKQFSNRTTYILSFVITIILVLLVISLIMVLLIPEIVRSAKSLYCQFESDLPQWLDYLESQKIGADWMENLIAGLDTEQVMRSLTDGMKALLPNVAGALSATISFLITFGFAVVIAIYVILDKERVLRHSRLLVCTYLTPRWRDRVFRFCRIFYQAFSNFLSGQFLEAIILGVLMFAAFTVFRLPYGSLVGVLTAICALIPYIGAFISGVVSGFLTLIYDPSLVIRSIVVYLGIQFIENQFIYPRVVGKSVGMPPLYTLLAAIFGGKMFGIPGIIFFIPLAAVVIELVKEDANRRTSQKLCEQ